jgi:hypothetical protein
MPINQISTSNTFAQWLVATQALIEKQNFVEDSANTINDTANNIVIYVEDAKSDINLVFSDTVNVYNNTVNVFEGLETYVSSAYDTANVILTISSNSYDTSNAAFDVANQAFILSNLAFQTSNTYFDEIFSLEPTESSNVHYPTFADKTIGVPDEVYIAPSKLFYVPSTGNLFSTIISSNTVITSNVTASGLVAAQDFNSTSDIALKENIAPIENSLDILERLNGIKFDWKDTKETAYGLSAQEVEQILPEIVKTRNNGMKGVNYLNIIAILIESVKELNREIRTLKEKK